MLLISGNCQNYQNGAVLIIQLTDGGRERVGDGVDSDLLIFRGGGHSTAAKFIFPDWGI
jgi:hypothetical protein